MAFSRKQKRWLIIIGSVILLLVMLIIFANIILSNRADSLLRKELSNFDTSKQLIDYKDVRVNIFNSSVSIRDISITPTVTVLENVKRSQLSKPVIELRLNELKVSGVSLLKALRGDAISVRKITLDNPEVVLYGNGGPFKGNGENNEQKGIFSSDTTMSMPLEEGRLGKFEIKDANFVYKDIVSGEVMIKTDGFNVALDRLWIHHPEGDTSRHMLDIEDAVINIGSHRMHLPGGFYILETGNLRLSYADKSLSLDSLHIIPEYPKGEFGKKFGKQTDRFEVSAANITLEGLVFDSLLNKSVIADKLSLKSPVVDICRDKRVPRDMSIFPKLFQTALSELPVRLSIPSVNVSNAYLNYQEIIRVSNEPGGVIIDQLDLDITGVCNYRDSIAAGQALLVNASGLLMNKASMDMIFYLPVGNHAEYFTFHGSLGSFPAVELNPLLAPLAFMEVNDGTINSVRFYAMAMNDTTAGRLEFKYQDLDVTIFKKQRDADGIIHENKLISFLARTALHKENPQGNKPVRIARMSFIRDRNKGFFNYVWKTIQDGLMVTLTPGRKNLDHDMGWEEFQKDWRKTLLSDWEALQANKKQNKRQ